MCCTFLALSRFFLRSFSASFFRRAVSECPTLPFVPCAREWEWDESGGSILIPERTLGSYVTVFMQENAKCIVQLTAPTVVSAAMGCGDGHRQAGRTPTKLCCLSN